MSKTTRTAQLSFGAGVIGPQLYSRLDVAKYQVGLKQCVNAQILPHGPAQNRAGFEFIKEVRYSNKATRLVEFIFSAEQAYVLEFGDLYVRFHTQGGTVLEATTNITGATSANPVQFTDVAHGYATGDDVLLAGLPGDFAILNGRYFTVTVTGANTFTINVDGSTFAAYTAGGTAARVYTVTTPYVEADLFDLHYVQSADVVTIVHSNYAPRELRRLGATNWTLGTITFAPAVSAPTGVTATATVGAGATTYYYAVTAVIDGEESLLSAQANCTNNLSTLGNYNTVTWNAVSGADRYIVYKLSNDAWGYIGTAGVAALVPLAFKDDNIQPDVLTAPPENLAPFGSAGNYPSTVTYFEQRRVFAATNNGPQSTWMSKSGYPANLSYRIPPQDDDSIVFSLASRQLNRVQSLVPLSDLLMFTNTGEWIVTSRNSDALTPITIWVRPQGYTGATHLAPLIARESVLFVQAQGAHFADMAFSNDRQSYKSRDISVMAPHLFDGYTFTDWAYTKAPYPIVWAVRNDGVLVGLTYLPDQDVIAFHSHETDGTFESVAAIPEGNQDALYVVVKRTINGQTKRYIERLHAREFATIQDAFFVDAGLSYDGAATSTITGLWHLEGAEVTILADGSTHPARTVANGRVTLDYAASKVHIGLSYTSDVEILPLVLQLAGYGIGTEKKLTTAYLRVHETRGIKVGPDANSLRDYAERTTEAYGAPVQPLSEVLKINLDSGWDREGPLLVRQTDPLPMTLLSIGLEVAYPG